MKEYVKEISLNVAIFLWLLFVLTNANVNLGNVYLWFLGISTILLIINSTIFNKKVNVTFQKTEKGHVSAFFYGLAGWIILLIASAVILKVVDPVQSSLGSIVRSFGASNPIFSDSAVINWFTIAVAVGYAETLLWSRVYEFISDRAKFNINRKNILLTSSLFITFALSILFVVFHLTAKGVEAVSSLVIVFIMMFLSLLMVAYFNGETRQAIWMHVIANGAAGALALLGGSALLS